MVIGAANVFLEIVTQLPATKQRESGKRLSRRMYSRLLE